MQQVLSQLQSEDKIQIQRGLETLAGKVHGLDEAQLWEAVQAVVGLFYIDPVDHPELLPVLAQAESLLADLREPVIPLLLRFLGDTDLKSHFHLAAVLGKIGHVAVAPLLQACETARDPYVRIFSLYALGKIKDAKVLDAVPLLFDALEDDNNEVRDTAARTLGKVCEHVNPDLMPEAVRRELIDRLLAKVSDRYAGVRSKAIRSLGKMARFGLLDDGQRSRLRTILARVLGKDDAGNWDLAYVVRAEASRARKYL